MCIFWRTLYTHQINKQIKQETTGRKADNDHCTTTTMRVNCNSRDDAMRMSATDFAMPGRGRRSIERWIMKCSCQHRSASSCLKSDGNNSPTNKVNDESSGQTAPVTRRRGAVAGIGEASSSSEPDPQPQSANERRLIRDSINTARYGGRGGARGEPDQVICNY